MKAIAITRPRSLEDADCFVAVELPTPQPGPLDLLVRVRAVSVNPVDTKVRRRRTSQETEPRILGWDAAGTVEAVGSQVKKFKPGTEVYYSGDITRPGSNAEFQLVDERLVGRKPRTLPYAEAAALPLTTITAWETLFDRLLITSRPTETWGGNLLILGGAGGVGSIMIQLARRLTGLTVVASASRPESAAWCRTMGAHQVINHNGDWAAELKALGIPQVEYLACLTEPDRHWSLMSQAIAPQGTIAAIVDCAAPVDLNLLKSKSVRFSWEFMFTRPMFQTLDMIQHHLLLERVAELVDQGMIRTTLNQVPGSLSPETLAAAHRQLESQHSVGKLVITVP